MAKSWKCEICTNPVSELGSFVKISASTYRHRLCHDGQVYNAARDYLHAQQEAEAQAKAERERVAREEQAKRERAERERQDAWDKAEEEHKAEVAERERTNRLRAQQAMPLPPLVQAPQPKPSEPPKQDQPKADRFDLIEME